MAKPAATVHVLPTTLPFEDIRMTDLTLAAAQTLVGGAGAGGAASPGAGSVAAAADVEEKKVAVADSAVPELGVTTSSGPSHGPAEAGGEHVDLQVILASSPLRC